MMHPRRLKGSPGNIARYYAIGDYYTKGEAERSSWGGALASELDLSGDVDPETFRSLLAGKVAGQQLGRHRADGIQHHPGWDFAISAPKSVSVMALALGDERIVQLHERSVDVTLAYLEEHAQLRKREEGNIVHETTGRLLWARFTEHASRELDPHLHTHVVVLNMTNGQSGDPVASLETRAVYAEQMTSGQIYRNELAHGLRELGYEIDFDPRRGLFEIRGVPKALIEEMSQRAEQINEHAAQHGLVGQASRRQSFYATRGAKVKTGIDTLLIQWRGRLGPYEKPLEAAREGAARSGEHPVRVDRADAARAALFGIRQSEGKEAVNPLGRLYTAGLASHVGEIRFQDLRPLIDAHEERRKLLATRGQTGDGILTRGRTTRRTVRLEQSLAMHLALAVGDGRPVASADRLLPILERAGLSPAQERALVDMGTSRDRVTGLHGVAGAGKSTLVRSLKDAALPGTTFIALAPTSSAAAELGEKAQIESRTVASLLAGDGYGISGNHVLVLDEAGQLGSRQALRVLEISRATGARLILLGDNKQTGAIEQGKAFWLMQKLGMETAELTESRRQETEAMRQAVAHARAGDYAASIGRLDKVVGGEDAATLAAGVVAEWTRLIPRSRAATNILVLDNASRLIVNSKIREVLQREGVVAAKETRLSVLTPGGLSDQEKRMARFYSRGQVVTFGRDQPGAGLGRTSEYRVAGMVRDGRGRQLVRLVDGQGGVHLWDPRSTKASQVNVFMEEKRDLSEGDRIQWRLASRELQLKNAERGTVETLDGSLATIRWDRDKRVQTIDLSRHRTWDHGYAETIYSAQSKTYDRVYVLAPVGSPLVNAQNFYTAITRARYGVKLWTQNPEKLVERLDERSGEKTSGLEGLGRLERDHRDRMAARQGSHLQQLKVDQDRERRQRSDRRLERELWTRNAKPKSVADKLAGRAQKVFETLDHHLHSLLSDRRSKRDTPAPAREQQTRGNEREGGRGLDR
ncbi:relaxase domain-containing protein [Sphingobium sp. JS3065]|uniref:MobF family relaxase n=1 Tax=Sphingobium sp. JS3065 TaxID=2970925 RepID=UPI002264231D|nr:MobF family relaxase [Sphingobium sp. JS3065]UZW57628.1 relaxase domain-containing protein [Sphingobium sp. JS3065]